MITRLGQLSRSCSALAHDDIRMRVPSDNCGFLFGRSLAIYRDVFRGVWLFAEYVISDWEAVVGFANG